MSWRIVKDQDSQTAALISDDPLYALGPVIEADSADEAAEAIEAFAVACDPAPDQQPTIRLMAEWQSYVQYLAQLQQEAAQAPPQAAAGDPAPIPGQTSIDEALADSGPENAPGMGPDHGAGGLTGDQLASAAQAEADRDLPPQQPAPAADDGPDCWCCGGSGKLNLAGEQSDCNVCQGAGRLQAVQR